SSRRAAGGNRCRAARHGTGRAAECKPPSHEAAAPPKRDGAEEVRQPVVSVRLRPNEFRSYPRLDHGQSFVNGDLAMKYEFLVESYASERLKVLSVWSEFGDEDLPVRPSPT